MKNTVTLALTDPEIASMMLLPGGLKTKLRAVLAAHIKEVTYRLEIGSESKKEASLRLWACRQIEPKVKWELVTWKIRGDVYFAPHRLDGNSQLGDAAKHTVAEEEVAA